MQAEFILYVADQTRSRNFYRTVLAMEPTLDVPGMTEFDLGGCNLGLMPEAGIARIVTPALPHPGQANGIARGELYLLVTTAEEFVGRCRAANALEVSPLLVRDWGHRVAYFADPDGHVLAIAEPIARS